MKSLTQFISEAKEKQFADTIVLSKEGTILLLQRAGYIKRYGGKYALPGGSVDTNETSVEAAAREVREETGLDCKEKELDLWKTWKYESGDKSYVYIWETGTPQEELESSIKISKEHRRYKFIKDISEIKETGWAGEQKDILQNYLENK